MNGLVLMKQRKMYDVTLSIDIEFYVVNEADNDSALTDEQYTSCCNPISHGKSCRVI